MNTEDFNFELPKHLIAQYPLDKRDESRLLHYNPQSKSVKHRNFKDITSILQSGDILVRNNSKVLPARLFVKELNAEDENDLIEILLIKAFPSSKDNGCRWEILGKPWKKIKIGHRYKLANGQEIAIEEIDKKKIVKFDSYEDFRKATHEAGAMPIPPYMNREADALDNDRYQTVYAKEQESGASVAAPTAGLHFTDEIFAELKKNGVEVIDLTLHVGTGTFLPIKVDNIHDHKMQSETYSIEEADWQKILDAKKSGRRIITVGSTSTRCLEAISKNGELVGETDIFIYPGYEFKIVDGILTNFHLPKSSLILLVSAFVGREQIMAIYKEAIENEYRFYSYGDCMLFCASKAS